MYLGGDWGTGRRDAFDCNSLLCYFLGLGVDDSYMLRALAMRLRVHGLGFSHVGFRATVNIRLIAY